MSEMTRAVATPLYDPHEVHAAYQLRYVWTAWPSNGSLPDRLPDDEWKALLQAWEKDGLRVLEDTWKKDVLQILFSTTPTVSPVFLAARAKGRLDHAFRKNGTPYDFSRKVSVRSIGDSSRTTIEQYIANQVRNGQFADDRFADFLNRFSVRDESVDLADPTDSHSGRYWYNLHLVLVTAFRAPLILESELNQLCKTSFQIAAKKGDRISILSPMPDHLHVALRGNIQHSPQDIALSFQNNLAFALGQREIWERSYYVGTFGEYDMNAVRMSKATGEVERGESGA